MAVEEFLLTPSTRGNGGDIHFDDAEQWTTTAANSNSKVLLPVAVHEIGHSLGLHHSSASGSMMNQFYSALNSNVALADDDIDGIQALYGMFTFFSPFVSFH